MIVYEGENRFKITTPERSIKVHTAVELEALYPQIVRDCGEVSPYFLKKALNAKSIDVSEGVVTALLQYRRDQTQVQDRTWIDLDLQMIDPRSIHTGYMCISAYAHLYTSA